MARILFDKIFQSDQLDRIEQTVQAMFRLLSEVLQKESIMAQEIDDLKAAVAAEGVELSHVQDAVTSETKRVEEVIANLKKPNPDIAAATATLQGHVTNMQTITKALDAVEPVTSDTGTATSTTVNQP